MPTYYAGKTANIVWNAVSLPLSQWSMTLKSEAVDVTNFNSAGFKESIDGLGEAEITASGPYSGHPLGITAGDRQSLTVNVNTTGPIGFTFTTAQCTQAKISADVKGAVQCEYTFVSSGSITLAT
jgi:hypothetical protein